MIFVLFMVSLLQNGIKMTVSHKKNEGPERSAVGIDAAESGRTAAYLDAQKITTVVLKEKE